MYKNIEFYFLSSRYMFCRVLNPPNSGFFFIYSIGLLLLLPYSKQCTSLMVNKGFFILEHVFLFAGLVGLYIYTHTKMLCALFYLCLCEWKLLFGFIYFQNFCGCYII